MDDRQDILSRVRQSLNLRTDDSLRQQLVDERMKKSVSTSPKAKVTQGRLINTFMERAQEVSASVEIVKSDVELLQSVENYLDTQKLQPRIFVGSDPQISALPWKDFPKLQHLRGQPLEDGQTGLSHAVAAVAETGSILLASGVNNPTSITLLSSHHLIIVRKSSIVATLEQAMFMATSKNKIPPRHIVFVTGPSRSADIEQVLILGAHGPKALHIIIR